MSNSLAPDQTRQNVGPDLEPNCLQRLSADDTSKLSAETAYCDNIGFPINARLSVFCSVLSELVALSVYWKQKR